MAYTLLWVYQVEPEKTPAFEQAYGSAGAWAALFRKSPGYLRTELLRDQANPRRFLTMDLWTSQEAWRSFRSVYATEYERLDAECGGLAVRETEIGAFEPVTAGLRQRYATGTPWEPVVGYSRAVRTGSIIHVSGTTATDSHGHLVGIGDPRAQTLKAIDNIQSALAALGASLEDVVRTRIYVVNLDDWESIGRAHGDRFGAIRPATSMVEVARLILPDMLVEIEAEAILGNP